MEERFHKSIADALGDKEVTKPEVSNRVRQLEDFAEIIDRQGAEGYKVLKPKKSPASGTKFVKVFVGTNIKRQGNYAILIQVGEKVVNIRWIKETDSFYWEARNRDSSQILLSSSTEKFTKPGKLPLSTVQKFMKKLSVVAPIIW